MQPPLRRFPCHVAWVAAAIPVAAYAAAAELPAAMKPKVECVYYILMAQPAIQSVDVYAIDESKSEIEYRFRGKNGAIVIVDLDIWSFGDADFPYNSHVAEGSSSEDRSAATDYLREITSHISICGGLVPSFVNVLRLEPEPPRQLVDMSRQ